MKTKDKIKSYDDVGLIFWLIVGLIFGRGEKR